MEEQKTKVCKVCGRKLPMSNFNKAGFGYHDTCKECVAAHRKEKRQKKNEVEELRRQLEEARHLRLSSFTPREMMEELYRQGYTGELEYHVVKKINIANF